VSNYRFLNVKFSISLVFTGEIVAKVSLKGTYLIDIWVGFQYSWFQDDLPLEAIITRGTFSLYKHLIDDISFVELILRVAIGRTESYIGNDLTHSQSAVNLNVKHLLEIDFLQITRLHYRIMYLTNENGGSRRILAETERHFIVFQ
jgi:hypothetical protein